MNTMFDLRCPACNRPVKGGHEIVFKMPKKMPIACPHCKTDIFAWIKIGRVADPITQHYVLAKRALPDQGGL